MNPEDQHDPYLDCLEAADNLKTKLKAAEEREAYLLNEVYDLKWALHIEVLGDHSEECDCRDHCDEAKRLLGDFKCPGSHCRGISK